MLNLKYDLFSIPALVVQRGKIKIKSAVANRRQTAPVNCIGDVTSFCLQHSVRLCKETRTYQRNCKIGQEPAHTYEFSLLRINTRETRCIIHIELRSRGHTPFPLSSDQEWIIHRVQSTCSRLMKSTRNIQKLSFFLEIRKRACEELILLLLDIYNIYRYKSIVRLSFFSLYDYDKILIYLQNSCKTKLVSLQTIGCIF